MNNLNGTSLLPDLSHVRVFRQPAEALRFMHEIQQHAVIVERGQTYVVTPTMDLVLGREYLAYSSLDDIRARYQNRQMCVGHKDGQDVLMPLGTWWLRQFDRREYKGVVFDPEKKFGDDCLDLWRGFAVDPKPGDWSHFQEHIFDVVCRRDDGLNDFVLDTFAAKVKRPHVLTENLIAMTGGEGTGKGATACLFGSLFAAGHFLPVHDARHLVGTFNAHLQNAVVLFLDEAVGFDDRHANAKVRALVTEPTILIEAKFKNPIHAQNVSQIIIASNDRHVVKAHADARRFLILDVDDKRRGDRQYFAALHMQMANGGRAAMLYDLQQRQISSTLNEPPQTSALLDTKLVSMDSGEGWWHERLREGQLITGDSQAWRTEVIRKILTEQYAQFVGRDRGKNRATSTELGLLLKKMLPPGYPKEKQRTVQPADRPSWNYPGLKPVERFWMLPSLLECRRHFDHLMRTPMPW